MDGALQLTIRYEESPASNNGIGIWVQVAAGEYVFPDILDIDAFFCAIETGERGLVPLFTCSCGSFGCGGYYIASEPHADGWVWANHYHPLEETLIRETRHLVAWADVRRAVGELVATLDEIQHAHPQAELFSGTYGLDLSTRIAGYEEIANRIS